MTTTVAHSETAAPARTAAAVVTGLGVVAPNGIGIEEFWSATVRGTCAIGPLTRFVADGYPARLAGEIRDFDPRERLPSMLLTQTDRMTQLALHAADLALADAGIDPAARHEYDMGVMTASSAGGFEFGQRELEKLWAKGSRFVSAYQSFAWFYAVNTGQIAIRHGMRGPTGVLVGEQAGGLDVIGQARRQIRKGTGVVVTGGVDSALCPWGWVAQLAGGRISERDDPAGAYLPFSADAQGHVPGEGGALLVLESSESAQERGLGEGYGRIAGYAATFDPRPDSGREPGLRRAAQLALHDAGIAPGEVDVVFADAAAVPELDVAEATALADLFGRRAVPVTAPKSLLGRLNSGGAPLDVATALLALRDGVIPPSVELPTPMADLPIDLVQGQARHQPLRTALVLARGRGGFNAAMVVRAPDASDRREH
ncbi:ketosynthase chain-length factor [Streptomyces sp. NPDC050759]|uniref:ketosynthase chain-length factor n=1 Tax=Streptomyces sp. NPDC050759 TaxID=3365635 RepID=UPI0037ACED7A